MSRQAVRNYIFVPGGAGTGYVQIPGNYSDGQIIAIVDATSQAFLYNFADTTLLGTVTWNSNPNNNFPTSIAGVTTVTFNINTAGYSSTDKLAIYVEAPYQAQRPFATDAVERQRVSNPQSLIDADFEYGLQNTKWQSLFVNNDNPSIYEVPGSDTYPNVTAYLGFTGNAITGAAGPNSSNVIVISNGISVGNNQPNWSQNDYALLWTPGTTTPGVTYLQSNVASQTQRILTIGNVAGVTVGTPVMLVFSPNTSPITTTTANLTAGQTALSITGSNNIVNGSMIMAFTGNTNATNGYQTELMMVTAGGGSGALTVSRNVLGTNASNSYIVSGSTVSLIGQVELANVVAINQQGANTISVQRGFMNTIAQDLMAVGTVVVPCNFDAQGATGANLEIVQMTTIGSAQGNIAQILRGALGTTPIPTVPIGSPLLRLTGIFVSGNIQIPQITINLPGHSFTLNQPISSQNHVNPSGEGMYQVAGLNNNYVTYYPKSNPSLYVGYQLNRWDTYTRYAGFYGTAALPPVSLTSDGQNPSTITATTYYAHGITPGTPIIANIQSATTGILNATGAFTVLSIPSATTFTYLAKQGTAVTNPVGIIYMRPGAFFTHRAADGGINLGTGTPHHGASAARQTKKYFRYQSGKGLMWTSGTLLGSNFDITNVYASGTGIGNTITITTDTEHQLQIGANINISGIVTAGYNGTYQVQQIVSTYAFQVNAQSNIGVTVGNSIIFGTQPKVTTVGWVGASVRAGMFDQQNGAFWENTGTSINVVLRSAVWYQTGTVSVETATNLATGDGTCKFTQQFKAGDRIILRGMTHTVTSVIDDNQITISPIWRGLTSQQRIKPSIVLERRYSQKQWNLDPLDGTGPSGYLLDPTKMQMLMIQYTWYGAGFIDFGVRGPDGNYIFCHRMLNNNLNYQAYMRSGNLPARYEAINDSPYAVLQANSIAYNNVFQGINSTDTTFTIYDSSQFPTPSPTSPVYVLIDTEIMKCTGITYGAQAGNITPATVTGVTRAATFNLFQDNSNKSFSAGNAQPHSSNVSVRVISATSGPSLNHWGSAVILDGGFDTDRGYAYTYTVANIVFPQATNPNNSTITAFAMRLAPSVSNQIAGYLGQRDLVNRAQLVLNNMVVNFSGANISTGQGARYLVEGILNPNNVNTVSTVFQFLQSSPYSSATNPSGAIQPSFAQVANGNVAANAASNAIGFTANTYAQGGERLFAIPVNATNSGQLDLSTVKQIGNSGIPGYNIYPDGPELLCINVTALVPISTQVTGEIQIQWTESQA